MTSNLLMSNLDHLDWQAFQYEWALRMIAISERAQENGGAELSRLVADRACREARGKEPEACSPLPKWFGPRVRTVLGPSEFCQQMPKWFDHPGVVPIDIGGKQVRCFVSEPYIWFTQVGSNRGCEIDRSDIPASKRWNHVVGDFAHRVPSKRIDDAQYLAKATGCELVIDRVAWWSGRCIRLLFRPLNHRLSARHFDRAAL